MRTITADGTGFTPIRVEAQITPEDGGDITTRALPKVFNGVDAYGPMNGIYEYDEPVEKGRWEEWDDSYEFANTADTQAVKFEPHQDYDAGSYSIDVPFWYFASGSVTFQATMLSVLVSTTLIGQVKPEPLVRTGFIVEQGRVRVLYEDGKRSPIVSLCARGTTRSGFSVRS